MQFKVKEKNQLFEHLKHVTVSTEGRWNKGTILASHVPQQSVTPLYVLQ